MRKTKARDHGMRSPVDALYEIVSRNVIQKPYETPKRPGE